MDRIEEKGKREIERLMGLDGTGVSFFWGLGWVGEVKVIWEIDLIIRIS